MAQSAFSTPTGSSAVQVNIAAWAAWAPRLVDTEAWIDWDGGRLPDDDGTAPDVHFVAALLRRRLGRLTRMALHVANQCAAGHASVATVFASRHGELARSVTLLHTIAANALPPPAAFSLSVHNTAAGIFSIARGDRAAASALAAGDETFLWGLLDAAVRLERNPNLPVLLVHADEPVPDEYHASRPAREQAHALALLLTPGAGLRLAWEVNADMPPGDEALSLAVLASWLGHRRAVEWHGERLSIRGGRNA